MYSASTTKALFRPRHLQPSWSPCASVLAHPSRWSRAQQGNHDGHFHSSSCLDHSQHSREQRNLDHFCTKVLLKNRIKDEKRELTGILICIEARIIHKLNSSQAWKTVLWERTVHLRKTGSSVCRIFKAGAGEGGSFARTVSLRGGRVCPKGSETSFSDAAESALGWSAQQGLAPPCQSPQEAAPSLIRPSAGTTKAGRLPNELLPKHSRLFGAMTEATSESPGEENKRKRPQTDAVASAGSTDRA